VRTQEAAPQTLSKRMASKKEIGLMYGLSFLSVLMLFLTLFLQKKHQDAKSLMKEMSASQSLVFLPEVEVSLLSCQPVKWESVCIQRETLGILSSTDFASVEKAISQSKHKINGLRLSYPVTAIGMKWAEKTDMFNLVVPRIVSERTTLLNRLESSPLLGNGSAQVFSLDFLDLQRQGGKIELDVSITGFPFGGPLDFPPALVTPDATALYQSLPERARASAGLGRQLQVSIPFVLCVLALFLDHSPIFKILALLGVVRGSRSFFALFAETPSGEAWVAENGRVAEICTGLLNGLSAFFLFFLAFYFWKRKNTFDKKTWIFAAGVLCIGFVFYALSNSNAWTNIDTVSDAVGALGACAVFAFALGKLLFSEKSFPKVDSEKFAGELRRQKIRWRFDLGFLLVSVLVFGTLGVGNASELFFPKFLGSDLSFGIKSVVDWKYAFFYPGLLVMAFFRVGVSSHLIESLSTEMTRKRLLEKELSVAVKLTKSMQGPRKGTGAGVKWRALQRQCMDVGGDFFDARVLEFEGGRKLIVAMVADATGHGIQAALVTNSIGSAWGAWCKDSVLERRRSQTARENTAENSQTKNLESTLRKGPEGASEKEEFLCHAPRRIHALLSSARIPGSATAVFALMDADSGEVTLCCAGHPQPLVMGETSHRNFICPSGGGIGGSNETPSYQAKTFSLAKGETLYLYSDGMFTGSYGLSMASFRKRPRLLSDAKDAPFDPSVFWKLFRVMQRHYSQTRPEDEDDITLLALGFEGEKQAPAFPLEDLPSAG
jgi:hypothetical protein